MTRILTRILLLSLLPIIAAVIYYRGQVFDPALIRFSPSEGNQTPKVSFFPDSVNEFKRTGAIRTFTKENLYEHINGHAEYFISAGFMKLEVGDYLKEGLPPGRTDAMVDLYDMGEALHAFGILSDEAGGIVSELSTGLIGIQSPNSMSFIKDRYYVKITAFTEDFPKAVVAEKIAENISGSSGAPDLFSGFPEIGEVVSTRFIKSDYRGMEFMKNVLERQYNMDGQLVQLFMVTGNTAYIDGLVTSYTDFFEISDIDYKRKERPGGIYYHIRDPYEGEWALIARGERLFGLFVDINNKIIDLVFEKTQIEGGE